jgi:2'-hydroxyisoflavone reductase
MLKGNDYGHTYAKNDKAIAAGLGFRPLATTVRDTLSWWQNVVPQQRKDTARWPIPADKEAEIIAAWKARK